MSNFDFSNDKSWRKIKVIGRGGSSTVYEAEFPVLNTIVAAKEIQVDGLMKDQVLAIEAEVDTMKSLQHENIVNYLGTQRQDSMFYIFLEYADRGSIRQFYQRHGALSENRTAYCTKQILNGLLYLHGNGIAHRDIKGANVLMTKKGELKLADFGASKRTDSASIVSGLKGTPHWMAPEVIKGTQMTTGWMKADVWSLGCTVVEMMTGALPFAEYENPMTAMYHIANGQSPPLGEVLASDELQSFVSSCCCVDPTARPSVDQLLVHPFVTNFPETNECLQLGDDDDDVNDAGSVISYPSQPGVYGYNGPDSPPPSPPPSPPSIQHTLSHEVSAAVNAMTKAMDDRPVDGFQRRVDMKIDTRGGYVSQPVEGTSDGLADQDTPHIHKTRKTRVSKPPSAPFSDNAVPSAAVNKTTGVASSGKRKVPSSISTLLSADSSGCDTPTPPASHNLAHKTPIPPKDAKTASASGRIRPVGAAAVMSSSNRPPPSPSSQPWSEAPTAASTPTGKPAHKAFDANVAAVDVEFSAVARASSSRAPTAVATRDGASSPLLTSPSGPPVWNVTLTGSSSADGAADSVGVYETTVPPMSTCAVSAVSPVPPSGTEEYQPVFHMWSEGDDEDAEVLRASCEIDRTCSGQVTHAGDVGKDEIEDDLEQSLPENGNSRILQHSRSPTGLELDARCGTEACSSVDSSLVKDLQEKLSTLSHSRDTEVPSQQQLRPDGGEFDAMPTTPPSASTEARAMGKSAQFDPPSMPDTRSRVADKKEGGRTNEQAYVSGEHSMFNGAAAGSMDYSDYQRPVAPLSSDKLRVYATCDSPSAIGSGAMGPPPMKKLPSVVVSKDKLSALETCALNHVHHKQHNSHMSTDPHHHRTDALCNSGNKQHWISRPLKTIRTKKGKVRSKSACVGGTASKLILPPVEHGTRSVTVGGLAGRDLLGRAGAKVPPYVPELQLRMIQSAPSVSRSINLPPILGSKTPSKQLQNSSMGQNPFLGAKQGRGRGEGGGLDGGKGSSLLAGKGQGALMEDEEAALDPPLAPRVDK